MKRKLGKQIIAGMLLGCMLFVSVPASASTLSSLVVGYLETKNPVLSKPKGRAETMGYRRIVADLTVYKDGYTSVTDGNYKNAGSIGGSVKTNWVSGPTIRAAGTTFKSWHSGYSRDGEFMTKSKYESY